MSKLLKEVYRKSPHALRLPVDFMYGVIPNKIKFGSVYREKVKFLRESDSWNKEQHENYQKSQLKKLLIHSYEHVPYYKKLFNESGFNPYSFKEFKDIEVLPLLNKEKIQQNFNDLRADNFSKQRVTLTTTGGTSGNQLQFYTEKNYNQVEWPFVEQIWSRVGYKENSSVVALRNHSFSNGKLFMYDWKQRRLILDNFHLTDSNIRSILDKISQSKIEYFHTYPSAILSLADYIRRTGYDLKYSPKAILATSENIYPGQKELIEKAFKCKFFTFYGHSERACIAGWCENSDYYHLQSEYGYTELIDENSYVIDEYNKRGEIICTGFSNYAMPLIRYQTGDFSSYAPDNSCSCNRSYKLLNSIEGRWMQEMLIAKDGSKISITALNMHSDIFKNVKNYQLYQDTKGECTVLIVRTSDYSQIDEESIYKEFIKKIGDSINFKIKYTQEITKTERGKYKYLIQKL